MMIKYLVLLVSFIALLSCEQKNTSIDTNKTAPKTNRPSDKTNTTKSAWISKTQTTNKGIIYSASLSASTVDTSFGNPITLTILCNQGTTEVTINWGQHVPRGSKMSVYLQLDAQQFANTEWRYLKDTETAYAYQPYDILPALITSNQLTIRTTFFQGSIATAKFDLTGSAQALKDIRKACYW
ncbi:type VI secretion system-associated protein TagO [Entomomonas asaccharolytica]|uniref:Uncharacterized protein n=1 Tax=Entomomonas asaccharolytica TaxID=2785331 RepID=A0A974NHE2_9GAMM|nr:type VI secretion system-associated protein TagO [Entomomonas asaccharolytica]QQP86654.1 hypothetical protein JHT90_05285 [Entomomonas asaccharolytica]